MLRTVVSLGSIATLVLLAPAPARAYPDYRNCVPNGYAAGSGAYGTGCLTCHNNADGGYGCAATGVPAPCLNPFGSAFQSAG